MQQASERSWHSPLLIREQRAGDVLFEFVRPHTGYRHVLRKHRRLSCDERREREGSLMRGEVGWESSVESSGRSDSAREAYSASSKLSRACQSQVRGMR